MPYDDRGYAPVPGQVPAAPRPGVRAQAPASSPQPPAVARPGIAPVQAPDAGTLNAEYDKQGYGPHSTEAQVDSARGQRNAQQAYGQLHSSAPVASVPTVAPQAPAPASARMAPKAGIGVMPAEAAWQTKAKAAQAGSPEWRQQFWQYDTKTGQHSFDHAGEAQARQGIGIGSQGTEPRDIAREAIVEQLKYHQEMARAVRNGGTINGGDAAEWGSGVMKHAAALQAHDASRADVQSKDSLSQLERLSKMGPAERAIYLLGKGVEPAAIAKVPPHMAPGPEPEINLSNYRTMGENDPRTRDAAAYLQADHPFDEQAAFFAAIPGIESPASPHRKLWDAHMALLNATGDGHQFDQYGNTGKSATFGHFLNPLMVRAGLASGTHAGQVGLRNQKVHANMRTLGYRFGPQAQADVSAKIGVKPVDD